MLFGQLYDRRKITAVDLTTGRRFTTNTKNVAQERDFNRIEPPDFLEMKYAEFEDKVAPVLKKLGEGEPCTKQEFPYVLNLITLLANRNSKFRKTLADFFDDVSQQTFRLMAAATKER